MRELDEFFASFAKSEFRKKSHLHGKDLEHLHNKDSTIGLSLVNVCKHWYLEELHRRESAPNASQK